MLKQKEIQELGIKAFTECLSTVPFLNLIELRLSNDDNLVDYQALIEANGISQKILLEFKTLGTPKSVREAINQLKANKQEEPDVYGVIIAPYISEQSGDLCKNEGMGYLDLSGNCYISFNQVFISKEQFKNKFSSTTNISSVYSPKSERVLRVLLETPFQYWKAIDLAEAANISLGMITHVGNKLIEEEWAVKDSNGIRLTKPEELLFDWAKNYKLNNNTTSECYSLLDPREIERKIMELCAQLDLDCALTGYSACNLYAPYVKGQKAMVYVNSEIDAVAQQLNLKSVSSGSNIVLINPYDIGVFLNTREMDSMRIVSPIQTYLDVVNSSERGEDAAEFLYKEVIAESWQHRKKNIAIN